MFLSLGPRPRIEPLFQLVDRWAELDGDDPWTAADAARLAAVRADRAAAAERYFASHAARMGRAALAPRRRERGRGGDRPRARRRADRAPGRHRHRHRPDDRIVRAAAPITPLGIDRSPEMLRLARVKLAEAGLDAVELRQGDMYALPLCRRARPTR